MMKNVSKNKGKQDHLLWLITYPLQFDQGSLRAAQSLFHANLAPIIMELAHLQILVSYLCFFSHSFWASSLQFQRLWTQIPGHETVLTAGERVPSLLPLPFGN